MRGDEDVPPDGPIWITFRPRLLSDVEVEELDRRPILVSGVEVESLILTLRHYQQLSATTR